MTARRTAAPVLLGGIAAAALTAVATAKPLARADEVPAGLPLAAAPPAELPLAAALALVVLACWGVGLVTRGRVRRGVLGLGLLAALGALVTLVAGAGTLRGEVREAYAGTGVTVDAGMTAWYPAAVAGAALSVLALALAVRLCPAWPEMGSRYDAPATAAQPAGAAAAAAPTTTDTRPADARPDARLDTQLDTWRALDEGRDPTEPDS